MSGNFKTHFWEFRIIFLISQEFSGVVIPFLKPVEILEPENICLKSCLFICRIYETLKFYFLNPASFQDSIINF